MSIAQCALQWAIHRTRTVPSSLRYFAVDFTCLLMLCPEVLYNTRYSGYGFTTRLSVIRHRCGCGSGFSSVRQRTHRHSSRTVLWSQCHNHRQPIGTFLMMPSNRPLRSVYFDPTRVGSYGGVDALRRVTRVLGNKSQETTHGRSTSAVAVRTVTPCDASRVC